MAIGALFVVAAIPLLFLPVYPLVLNATVPAVAACFGVLAIRRASTLGWFLGLASAVAIPSAAVWLVSSVADNWSLLLWAPVRFAVCAAATAVAVLFSRMRTRASHSTRVDHAPAQRRHAAALARAVRDHPTNRPETTDPASAHQPH